ncbi:MAG: tetratricopeptide repeat protein, partial [Planctomycetota bacterium]
MQKRWPLATAILCSAVIALLLLNSTQCFSNDATTPATKNDGTHSSLNFVTEQYKQGLKYAQYGLHTEAIDMYKKALSKDPTNLDIYTDMGKSYAQNGMPDEAIEAFLVVIAKRPNSFDAQYNLGSLYFEKGLFEQAIDSFKKATLINLDNRSAYSLLGIAYSKLGKFDEAIQSFKKCI